ncbi:M50 family metallopeptidase [Actinokineospora guangxiensis]|uniref:M50 family metallopeptidase n=1 Tax=Actinokineospora guangxiensis TaxID=1490288 RepID=A0ABW0EUC7_9PSEU
MAARRSAGGAVDGELLGGRLSAALPAPGWWLVAGTGVLAAASVLAGQRSRARSHGRALAGFVALGTLVHEAGHAFAAIATGGGVRTISVDSAESGVTWTWFPSWLSNLLTTFAGYAAPPLAGLGAAALLDQGRAPAVLTITLAVSAFVLLVARGWFTFLVVLAVGGTAFCALHWGGPLPQQAIAYSLAWLLLLTEAGGVLALVRLWRRGGAHGDAHALAALTRAPAPIWIAAWAAVIGWSCWTAVPLLWP